MDKRMHDAMNALYNGIIDAIEISKDYLNATEGITNDSDKDLCDKQMKQKVQQLYDLWIGNDLAKVVSNVHVE